MWTALLVAGCYESHEQPPPACSLAPPEELESCAEWRDVPPAAVCWVGARGELRPVAVGPEECTLTDDGRYATRSCIGPGATQHAICPAPPTGTDRLRFEGLDREGFAVPDASTARCDALPSGDSRCGSWTPSEGARRICPSLAPTCTTPGMLEVELVEGDGCLGSTRTARCSARLMGGTLDLTIDVAPNCLAGCLTAIGPTTVRCGVPPARGRYRVVVNGSPAGSLYLGPAREAGTRSSCLETGKK